MIQVGGEIQIKLTKREMAEQNNMQDEGGVADAGDGRMVTALAWISRGFAKPVLEQADPEQDEKNIMMHSRM